MFTQNWYNIMRFYSGKFLSSSPTASEMDTGYSVIGTDGTEYTYAKESLTYFQTYLFMKAGTRYPAVYCGTDNTAESLTDYSLSSGATAASVTEFKSDKGAGLLCTFSNSTTQDFVISEIMVNVQFVCGTTSSTNNHSILIYRKVLSEPITVPSGNSYAFKLRLGE